MEEVWRDIHYYQESSNTWFDFRGEYQVSNYGEVRNVKTGNILTPTRVNIEHKYLRVHIKKHMFRIHRIVAFMFPEICGKWFEGATVNHKDGNPQNNVAENLEWLSMEENLYAAEHRRPKPITQLTFNGEEVRRWNSINQAARELGIGKKLIREVCRGKARTAYGFLWRYA